MNDRQMLFVNIFMAVFAILETAWTILTYKELGAEELQVVLYIISIGIAFISATTLITVLALFEL